MHTMKTRLALLAFAVLLCGASARADDKPATPATPTPAAKVEAQLETYSVDGINILKTGVPQHWRGVNVLDVFGYSKGELDKQKEWNVDIVRVVVTNMVGQPLTGGAQKVGNNWLHPLDAIVKAHRAYGRVVILCPFGWDGQSDSLFLGKNPSQTRWWNDYLAKYREWAAAFKGDPGVWFELWNEPYAWDGKNGWSHELWLGDAQAMVDNIRQVAPDNVIVVPGGKMSGDETVIADKGPDLLKGRKNIVFDLHAYNAWLPQSREQIEARVRAVQDKGCAMIFAECGTSNAGYEMDPANFLGAVAKLGVTTLAWIWKEDKSDGNALLGPGGAPSEAGKYKWGKTFYDFSRAERKTAP